jgi:ATP-dependent helicase HepA
MNDPFIDLCLGVQALRRTTERQIAGLGGATGVAAMSYPHQLSNVHRILTDSRIRHLIADEVGLGKTVQALMVLNALRLQNPRHRTLIVVPENLAPQWLLECQSRAHFLPLDTAPTTDVTGPHVRLAYREQLRSVTEIDPSIYDLLIVDEIQRLQSDARQRIADVAGDFRQLLLLSATPKLEDVQAFRQILTILEPDRMAIASRSSDAPEDLLRMRENAIATFIDGGTSDQWDAIGLPFPPKNTSQATIAIAHCLLRRVIHTRRRDYPVLLPQRVHHRIIVEPTSDERERLEHVWRYISHSIDNDISTDLARLGQVALRCPRALSERINVLRRRDQRDPDGLLYAATRHLNPSNGDSRLEALIDLLAEIWNVDPEESVLIVAEDNPTVDYLSAMIPQFLPTVGPQGYRRPLVVATKRNRDVAATADIVDLFVEYDESLGGFVSGQEQLLIAADLAQVGLNLQHARKLIFFSIPWSPVAVEQWIGRLDRLGSAALEHEPGERNIDIYTVCQRGQVDERVVSLLDDFRIFERSIRLDGDEINVVSQHIVDAALSPHTFDWGALSEEIKAFACDDSNALNTPLSTDLPWRPQKTRAFAEHYDQVGVLGPVLEPSEARRAIVRSESALRNWMRLIEKADGLRLSSGEDKDKPSRKFRLLHYYRSRYLNAPIEPRFFLPGIEYGAGQRYAYLDRRRLLESPPAPTVHVDGDPARPLNFLDHGDAVHETLAAEWAKLGKAVPNCLEVLFPEGHPLKGVAGQGVYLLAILNWVPGDLHLPEFDRSHILQQLEAAKTQQEQKPLLDALQYMEEELRADRFWLNGILTSRLDVLAARYETGTWELVDEVAASALVTPWSCAVPHRDRVLSKGNTTNVLVEVKTARDAGMALLRDEHVARHHRSIGDPVRLANKIASRRYLIDSESLDQISWRQSLLDDATLQGLEKSEQGFARSRFRAIRNARDMAVYAREVRLARIDKLLNTLSMPTFNQYKVVVLTVQ